MFHPSHHKIGAALVVAILIATINTAEAGPRRFGRIASPALRSQLGSSAQSFWASQKGGTVTRAEFRDFRAGQRAAVQQYRSDRSGSSGGRPFFGFRRW